MKSVCTCSSQECNDVCFFVLLRKAECRLPANSQGSWCNGHVQYCCHACNVAQQRIFLGSMPWIGSSIRNRCDTMQYRLYGCMVAPVANCEPLTHLGLFVPSYYGHKRAQLHAAGTASAFPSRSASLHQSCQCLSVRVVIILGIGAITASAADSLVLS